MSMNSNTPVDYWLSIPLREFAEYIDVMNQIIEERSKKAR